MASNQVVKVDIVDSKKNKGKKLADKSVRAFIDVNEAKDLIGGQGGESMIVKLEDYVDITTMAIKDLDGIKEAINDGKMFYMNENDESSAIVFDGLYNGSITNDHIILTGTPLMQENEGAEGGAVLSIKLFFNKDTGVIDVTKSMGNSFTFTHSVNVGGVNRMKMGKLEIEVNGTTYEYDGSEDVFISLG